MTIQALATFYAHAMQSNSSSSSQILLKLAKINGKESLIAIKQPTLTIGTCKKLLDYWIDRIWNKEAYKLKNIAQHIKNQTFRDEHIQPYIHLLNKKIDKHNLASPENTIGAIFVTTISTNIATSTSAVQTSIMRSQSKRTEPSTPLQSNDIARLERARSTEQGKETDVLINYNTTPITRKSMRRMKDGQWLDDELINIYMDMIMQRSTNNRETLPKTYCLNTFFLPKLQQNSSYNYQGVSRWFKNIDLFLYDLILIPVHTGGNHWCLAVINIKNKQFEYYDSLQYTNHDNTLRDLHRWTEDRFFATHKVALDTSSWKDEVCTTLPIQTNEVDCGIFMCQYANCISQQRPFSFNQSQIPDIRRRMVLQFLDKSVEMWL